MDKYKKYTTKAGGVDFFELLTIAFIVLKLTHIIEWSWLWVLAPVWISWLIVLIIVLVIIVAERREAKK